MSEVIGLIQAIAMTLTAILALLAWLESRKTTAKVRETHELVNSSSSALLEVSKGIAFREGVEHADATDAAKLAGDLGAAETKAREVNGLK